MLTRVDVQKGVRRPDVVYGQVVLAKELLGLVYRHAGKTDIERVVVAPVVEADTFQVSQLETIVIGTGSPSL
jgi:hypothetical protein